VIVASIALLGAVVGAAAGWWIGGTRSTGYASTATVRVRPLAGNAFSEDSTDTLVSLQTEAQLARSDEVLQAVAASAVGPTDVNILRRRIGASVSEGSEVIVMSYRSDSAAVSEQVVDTLANSVLDLREHRATTAQQAQVALVKASRDAVKAEIAGTQDPGLQRVLNQRLVVLDNQLTDIKRSSLDPGEVIGVRTVRASKKAFRLGLVVAGAAVGALVGFVVARRVGRPRRRSATA
jgi:hypothetical protein